MVSAVIKMLPQSIKMLVRLMPTSTFKEALPLSTSVIEVLLLFCMVYTKYGFEIPMLFK